MTFQRDRVTWAGLAIVGITAIVWSFTALSDLARRVGVIATIPIPWTAEQVHVAWGLPITVDVLALVATRVWLRGTAPDEAVRYARRAAWGAILATILGNSYHGLLVGDWRVDALIVSAAPAVVIGVIVHLAVLATRPGGTTPPTGRNRAAHTDVDIDADALDDEAAELFAAAEAERAETGGLPDRRAIVDVPRDGAVIDDLRALEKETGRRYVRDEVKEMYGIGSTRASRLLTLMGWMPRAEPGADEAEAAAR
jgi:Protein of unknown function (DUF2637)